MISRRVILYKISTDILLNKNTLKQFIRVDKFILSEIWLQVNN